LVPVPRLAFCSDFFFLSPDPAGFASEQPGFAIKQLLLSRALALDSCIEDIPLLGHFHVGHTQSTAANSAVDHKSCDERPCRRIISHSQNNALYRDPETRLHHSAITVSDRARSKRSYCDVTNSGLVPLPENCASRSESQRPKTRRPGQPAKPAEAILFQTRGIDLCIKRSGRIEAAVSRSGKMRLPNRNRPAARAGVNGKGISTQSPRLDGSLMEFNSCQSQRENKEQTAQPIIANSNGNNAGRKPRRTSTLPK
jgi:hypothetical protein